MRISFKATANYSPVGYLATCSAVRLQSQRSCRTPAFKSFRKPRSAYRFSSLLQASVQKEGQRDKGKSITIPIKSDSDEKIVGAALAQMFQRYGTGSVICEDISNLEKCYRILSLALSFLRPDVWITFKEVGRLFQGPDKTVFRPLRFTLMSDLGSEILNTGFEDFQVTSKTQSQRLADAMAIVLKSKKIVGLRSVGFNALLNSTNAAKKVRRDYKASRDMLVVRPKVYRVKDGKGPIFVERVEIACARIPFFKEKISLPEEGFGWKNAKPTIT